MRDKASECLQQAKYLIAKDDDVSAKYACLELRFCIEYITYSQLQEYLNEVSNETMKKWTPKQIIGDLLEIDPDVDKSFTVSIGKQEQLGIPAKEMTSLGIDFRFSLKWANKQHNALGNFLHAPTLLQIEQRENPTKDKILEKATEVINEIEKILDSPIFNVKIKYYVGTFKCEFCEEVIKYGSKDFNRNCVYCSKCKAIYDIILNGDKCSFKAKINEYKCYSCETVNSIGVHLIFLDNVLTCKECGKTAKIGYTSIPV